MQIYCLFSLYYFIKILGRYVNISASYIFILFSIAVFLFYNSASSIYYLVNFYIYSSYTLGICILFIFTARLLIYLQNKTRYNLIILFTVLIVLNETIEIYPVLAGFIVFYFMIFDILKHKRIDLKLCLLILLCIIRLFFYYFQPGTTVKLNLYSEGTSIPFLIRLLAGYKSLYSVCEGQLNLLLSIKIFPFLSVFATIFAIKLYRHNIFYILINALIPFISLFIVVTIMSFAYRYIIPNTPHIYNVVNIFFTIFICILLTAFISLLIRKIDLFCRSRNLYTHIYTIYSAIKENIRFYHICIYGIVLLYAIVNTTVLKSGLKTRQAWKELLLGYGKDYSEQMFNRYAVMLEDTEAIVTVPALKNLPYTIAFADLPSDINELTPSHIVFANFFGKEAAIAEKKE